MSRPMKINPVAVIRRMRDSGMEIENLAAAMNGYYAVVKYGSKTVVASTVANDLDFMDDRDFHKMFSNLFVHRVIQQKNGTPTKVATNLSRFWIDWDQRRQYVGRGVVFEPGGPLQIQGDMLNIWRGFGVDPKQGDWSLMRNHIFKVVCSERQEHYDYLIRWMAYAVQHVDQPMGVAVALLGAQGAGKGIVARTFGSFFGKHFAHIANGDQLTGRFNASLASVCAVFLDEAVWAGDKKGEGVLKALITEPTFQLEVKFRDLQSDN